MGYFVIKVVSGFSFASLAPLPLPTLAGTSGQQRDRILLIVDKLVILLSYYY